MQEAFFNPKNRCANKLKHYSVVKDFKNGILL